MGAGLYEVVIVNVRTGEQASREWSGLELLKGVPWLKRMNARGGDIYIRPLDGPELLLIDELSAEALKDMRCKGFVPAVVTETGPAQFQAWVKLSDRRISEGLRKHAVAVLSGVLPKIGRYGRLAGFTNQGANRNETGGHPYVLAHDVTEMISPTAKLYLAAIERKLQDIAAERGRCVVRTSAPPERKLDKGHSR